ncbi:hypothetical protein GGR57DRAFT_94975 [Xylariaceae sp. FL1272]|nr:hypothetical protein GGR57DRAFT_94975 [Xylariaceae sp. FL1272]
MMNWWKQRQAKRTRKRTAHQPVDYRDRWPTTATLVEDRSPPSSPEPTWSETLSSTLFWIQSFFKRHRNFGPGESTHPYDIAYSQPTLEECEVHMTSSMDVQASEPGSRTWWHLFAGRPRERSIPPPPITPPVTLPVMVQPPTIGQAHEKSETPKNATPLRRLLDIPRSRTGTPARPTHSPVPAPIPAPPLAKPPVQVVETPQVATQQPRVSWFSPKATPTPVQSSVKRPVTKTPVPTTEKRGIEEPALPRAQRKRSWYARLKRRWSTARRQTLRVYK